MASSHGNMIQASQPNGYSSDVELTLALRDARLSLSAIAPDSITLRECYEAPPGPATVLMKVDGREHRWNVYLTDGLKLGSCDARVQRLSYEQPAEPVHS